MSGMSKMAIIGAGFYAGVVGVLAAVFGAGAMWGRRGVS